jgi:hypothetical protein
MDGTVTSYSCYNINLPRLQRPGDGGGMTWGCGNVDGQVAPCSQEDGFYLRAECFDGFTGSADWVDYAADLEIGFMAAFV